MQPPNCVGNGMAQSGRLSADKGAKIFPSFSTLRAPNEKPGMQEKMPRAGARYVQLSRATGRVLSVCDGGLCDGVS